MIKRCDIRLESVFVIMIFEEIFSLVCYENFFKILKIIV